MDNRYKALRKKYGYTQNDIGQKIGMTQKQYGRFERGEITADIKIVEQLASIYNVTIDYLLGSSDEYDNDIVKLVKRLNEPQKRWTYEMLQGLLEAFKPEKS